MGTRMKENWWHHSTQPPRVVRVCICGFRGSFSLCDSLIKTIIYNTNHIVLSFAGFKMGSLHNTCSCLFIEMVETYVVLAVWFGLDHTLHINVELL